MKLLSGILAPALASVVALASANAADMYRPDAGGYKDGLAYVSVNWSGLYIGANAGYGWSDHTDYLDPTGAFGGGQIGYNIQRGNIVFGVEADIQAAGITDSGYGNSSRRSTGSAAFAAAPGYAFDRALVYTTGGFAYGQVTNSGASETQTGWTLGTGLEYKITPVWSAKIEYQYYRPRRWRLHRSRLAIVAAAGRSSAPSAPA